MTASDQAGPRGRWALIALLVAAFVLRAVWGLLQPADDAALDRLPDQLDYLRIARNLVDHGQMSFYDQRFDQEVYAFRPPGYPLFVALCGADVRVVRLAQALIDTSTVLAAYLLARRWLGWRGAMTAAVLVAVNPLMVHFTSLLLTETFFTALLAWGLVLICGDGLGMLLGAAMVLALSALVRPSVMALAILLALAGPRPWRSALAVAAAIALVLLPWAWRNQRQLGSWVWTTTNVGITLADGFHDGATGASDQRPLLTGPSRPAASEIGRDVEFAAGARAWIAAHPGEALRLAPVKIARTWSPAPLSREFGRPLYRAVGLAFGLPFDLLILAGLCRRTMKENQRAKIMLLLPAIYLTLTAAASVGSMRYRLPAEPELAVVAAAGAVGWLRPGKTGIRAGSDHGP